MLDYSFGMYKLNTVVSANKVVGVKKLSMGEPQKIKIVPSNDVNVLVKKMSKDKDITYKTDIYDINLPVKKGDVVGKIYLYEDGKKIATENLTVKEDIKKANIFKVYLRNIKNILGMQL